MSKLFVSMSSTTPDRQALQGLPSEREVAFIALRFLSQFDCNGSVQRLAEDLGNKNLLPVEYDWEGNLRTISFDELSNLYSHIDNSFLMNALGYALPRGHNAITTFLQVPQGNRANGKIRSQSCIHLLLRRATQRVLMSIDEWPTSFLYKNIKRLKTVVGHVKPVYCIAFDSFAKYLVTGADDHCIKVWSVETGYLLYTLKFHEGEITDLALHPWKPILVSASNDSSLCVWDLHSGVLLNVLKGHSRGSSAVTFSRNPEHPFVASGGSDGCILLWNIDHPELGPVCESLTQIQRATRRIEEEDELDDDFIPPSESDERWNNVEDDTSNDRMDIQGNSVSGTEPASPEENSSDGEGTEQYLQILSLEFNNAGTLLAVGATNHRAYLYRITYNGVELPQVHQLSTLKGHIGAIYHVRFSHRGERLATGGTDGRSRIWKRKNIQGTQWSSLMLSMRQDQLGPSSTDSTRSRRVNEPPRVTSLVWSLEDKFVVTASSDCKIRVWNSISGELIHCLNEHQDHIYVLDTNPCDKRIILSADHHSEIILWDIEQGVVLKKFELTSPEMSFHSSFAFHHRSLDGCFSPNGMLFAISDESGAFILFGHGNGENLALAPEQQFFVHDLQAEQFHTLEERERRAKVPSRGLLCDMRGVAYPLGMQPLHIFRQHNCDYSFSVEQAHAHSDLIARAEASRQLELEEQERIAREERARARAAAIARLRREMNDSDSEDDECDDASGNIRQRLRKRVSRRRAMIEYPFSESSESSSDPELVYSTSDYSTSDDTVENSSLDGSENSVFNVNNSTDSQASVSDVSSPNMEDNHYLRSRLKRSRSQPKAATKLLRHKRKNGRNDVSNSKGVRWTQSKISIRRKLNKSEWLRALSNDFTIYEYVPQVDDEIYYFPKGHLDFVRAEGIGQKNYVELVEYFQDEKKPKKLKICSVEYIIVQRRKPYTAARLQVTPLEGQSSEKVCFELDYMFSEQVPDFVVLASRVESSLSRHWRVGEHFRTVYIGRDGQKSFYYGTVRSVSRKMLSPWDLMEPIDVSSETELNEPWVSILKTWTKVFEEDEPLIEICSPFFVSLEELVVFPGYTDVVALPLNLEIVYLRLKYGFYRSLNSFDNDLKLVRDNCILYNEEGSAIQGQARQMYERLFSIFIASICKGTSNNGFHETVGSSSHTPSRRTKVMKRIEISSEEE
ncbi:Bromodomain and WD repeat-containing DDB_G0285837 [Galdieria sulphuraria]|nr:Bromodomain and WD repeat-containing DDB_G0285837 [Galdieria sulphuraria]